MTRDGTAEPVSRDQILRRERVRENTIFPVQLTTSRIGNLPRLTHPLAICLTIHTFGNIGKACLEVLLAGYALENKEARAT